MLLNLNDLLLAISSVLDFVEMDILGVASNHSKRVAYISHNLAKEINLSSEECFDIVALSILHDNGFSEKILHNNLQGKHRKKLKDLERIEDHCIIGEENIKGFLFLTDVTNIIKYHHERYDGTGLFGIKGEDIPLMAQIISFADTLDLVFNLKERHKEKEEEIFKYLEKQENKLVSSRILEAFYNVYNKISFSLDLKDEFVDKALIRNLPSFGKVLHYKDIRNITKVFSKIIDCKSEFTAEHSLGLSDKVSKMADYYNKSEEEKFKLMIAADLHDLGKLAIPNSILDKTSKLSNEEFLLVKTHAYYTRTCLESLNGFNDITEWASNHHERLNGLGYPHGLSAENLDFNSRLLACLDIYQALTEDRPYRGSLTHKKSVDILYEMANDNLIDHRIVKDIDCVFESK